MPRTSAIPLRCPPMEFRPNLRDVGRRQECTSRRDEMILELCEGLIDVSAALFSVPSKELRSMRRTVLSVSRVRQIAMYVAHIAMGLSPNEVGRGFGRDRTTVLYSCRLVEEMRDNIEFDRVVAMVERVTIAAFRDRLEALR